VGSGFRALLVLVTPLDPWGPVETEIDTPLPAGNEVVAAGLSRNTVP
jgi:hypothetical protein